MFHQAGDVAEGITPAASSRTVRLRHALSLLLSCCHAHMQVIGNCTSALKIDPKNGKALYRRAFAAISSNDYDTVCGAAAKP